MTTLDFQHPVGSLDVTKRQTETITIRADFIGGMFPGPTNIRYRSYDTLERIRQEANPAPEDIIIRAEEWTRIVTLDNKSYMVLETFLSARSRWVAALSGKRPWQSVTSNDCLCRSPDPKFHAIGIQWK